MWSRLKIDFDTDRDDLVVPDFDPVLGEPPPRGPSMDIRPKPEQCREWAERVGLQLAMPDKIDLPPYHYGWAMEKR